MYLPIQAEPVERTVTRAKQVESERVEPQWDCWCDTAPPGTGTIWCIVGRDMWNTQQPC